MMIMILLYVITGSDHVPQKTSVRMFIAFFWLFSVAIMATYTGNLVAFLTVAKNNLPFDSIEELAEQEVYHASLLKGVALEELFKVGERGNNLLSHIEEIDPMFWWNRHGGGAMSYVHMVENICADDTMHVPHFQVRLGHYHTCLNSITLTPLLSLSHLVPEIKLI